MKKCLFLFVLPLLVACSAKGPNEAVIAGKISNYSGTIAYLTSRSITDTITLTDGAFVFKKTINQPQFFIMHVGRSQINLYLVPGDSTYFEYSLSNPTPVFSGDNAKIQNGIAKINSSMKSEFKNWMALYSLEKTAFNTKIDSIQNQLDMFLNSVENELKQVASLEVARIKYVLFGYRLRYPEVNAFLQKTEINPDEIDYSFLDKINPNIAEHLMFPEYCEMVNLYVNAKSDMIDEYKQVADADVDVRLAVQFKLIDSLLITNELVRDNVKMSILDEHISHGRFYLLGDLVSNYVATCQTPEYANSIQKKFNEKMVLAPGTKAPTYLGKTLDGEDVSLDKFAGKLVYLDFWATWCAPCRAELPYLEEFETDYKNKNIVFISLSIDDNIEAWKKMVKEKKMKGVQLNAPGAWRSEAATNYQVIAIPTFYLIGADGKIIDPSAPRPSSENIRPLFDSELNKL